MNTNSVEDIKHIREIMEKSTRFLSLSGWSGIASGIIALLGGGLAYRVLEQQNIPAIGAGRSYESIRYNTDVVLELVLIALGVLFLSFVLSYYFTYQKSKKMGQSLWSKNALRMLFQLAVPLICGAFLSIIFIQSQLYICIAPTLLMFYGLALVAVSRYTFGDILYLGLLEIALGMIGFLFPGYGLPLWMLGFGVLHILYGAIMAKKYK